MSSLDELYKQSSLSFSAYADLFRGIAPIAYRDALVTDAEMSGTQAERFANQWG
jgi:hypothetical protein